MYSQHFWASNLTCYKHVIFFTHMSYKIATNQAWSCISTESTENKQQHKEIGIFFPQVKIDTPRNLRATLLH